MPTLAEIAEQAQQRRFVGRERALQTFEQWLEDDRSDMALLNITGHGGLGKTALLRRFAVVAQESGRGLRELDGRQVPTPQALHRRLGGDDLDTCVKQLNTAKPVVLLDTFEAVPGVARHLLDELLPRLDAGVKVVVAARHRLVEVAGDHPLTQAIREVRLQPFDVAEVGEYLARRGVDDPDVLRVVMVASAGNPLAVTMAADLVTELGSTDLRAAADWRDAVRSLTERMVRDVDEPTRQLLEAAAIVRQFDHELLSALVEADQSQLRLIPRLSFVRSSERGLRLHDDVRRILADDLRATRPQRYADLRARALGYYRRQFERAAPEDREWLIGERLYLWEHDFIRNAFFPEQAGDEDIFLEVVQPSAAGDHAAVVALWQAFGDRSHPVQGGAPSDDLLAAEVEKALDLPGASFIIARQRDGRVVGVGPEVRVGADNVHVLPPVLRSLVDAYFADPSHELPANAEDSPYRYMGPVVAHGDVTDAVMGKLARWAFGSWIHGGTILTATTLAGYAGFMEMLGFQRLPLDIELRGRPVHGLILELEADDIESWIERITGVLASMPAPSEPAPAEPAPAAVGVSIRVLGGFSVMREGEDVTPSGTAAAAVKHLAVSGGALHVAELAERLWPDAAPDRGRVRLRNVLRRVQDASGPLVQRVGERVHLQPGAVVDADRFVAAVNVAGTCLRTAPQDAAEAARAALAMYEGDLLPGDLYADQFASLRERLRRQRLNAHDLLAEAAAATGDRDEAVRVLEQAIELDRFDESRYLKAACVLHDGGRTGQAIRVLQRARAAMVELGVKPSAELEQLDQTLHR